MNTDQSLGWESVAQEFQVVRSDVGASLVRTWARKSVPPRGSILDIGCGSGLPITRALVEEGFTVAGIDPSLTLITAFHANFPDAQSACETVEESAFFGETFDAAVAVGLIFLLTEQHQKRAISRIATALPEGGRLLFSAPVERCEWQDTLTGRTSRSLGGEAYEQILLGAGLELVGTLTDEGGNHYYDAKKLINPSWGGRLS